MVPSLAVLGYKLGMRGSGIASWAKTKGISCQAIVEHTIAASLLFTQPLLLAMQGLQVERWSEICQSSQTRAAGVGIKIYCARSNGPFACLITMVVTVGQMRSERWLG